MPGSGQGAVTPLLRSLAGIPLCVAVAIVMAGQMALGGDWPQILGPNRNGAAQNERIVDALPATGPAVVWEYPVGQGYAGVAVLRGRVIVFHRRENEEIVEALDAATGGPLWKQSFPTTYRGGIAPDNGPRCVPLVRDGRVFLYGAAGNLHCVSFDKGERIWSRPVAQEHRAPDGYFGAGSTPIVEGNKLLVNVGGRSGAGIVAFSLADGKTAWSATDEQASYSSPVATTLDGERHVIFVTRLNVVSIDPDYGGIRWSFPFGERGTTVNAASPVVFDGHVFVTASYGIGATFSRFGKKSVQQLWANDETLSSQYITCVVHEGLLYGSHGRADGALADLRCFEPKSGKIRWTDELFGTASLILADGKLILVRDDGTLVLVKASPEKYEELGRAQVLDTTTRALPALAGGRLYVRDTRTLKCLELGRR